MRVTLSLHHGPLDVEIQAQEEEDYGEELLQIIEFIQNNPDVFESLIPHPEEQDTHDNGTQTHEKSDEREHESQEYIPSIDFSSVSRKTEAEESALGKLFDVPKNEEEIPSIIVEELDGGVDTFGTSRRERQAKASLALLYVWQEIRDVEEVSSSSLGDALHMSGVDPDQMYAMYDALGGDADSYFNRTSGGNSTVSLSRRGERAAVDQIKELIEHMKS